ncbi:MAG: hypothetical protein A2Y40_04585 [Candidatus Margulisbacteria bacterium GWF2_35_9]|nr:MAG: hypothetical protein A2Y40_04585 [Candidatus Margulisbacteria bacterium GWF2_35_9]
MKNKVIAALKETHVSFSYEQTVKELPLYLSLVLSTISQYYKEENYTDEINTLLALVSKQLNIVTECMKSINDDKLDVEKRDTLKNESWKFDISEMRRLNLLFFNNLPERDHGRIIEQLLNQVHVSIINLMISDLQEISDHHSECEAERIIQEYLSYIPEAAAWMTKENGLALRKELVVIKKIEPRRG